MLGPGARTRLGGWHRGQVLGVSMVLRKDHVATRPGIDFGRLLRSSMGPGWMLEEVPGALQAARIVS